MTITGKPMGREAERPIPYNPTIKGGEAGFGDANFTVAAVEIAAFSL